jgi:hypothetical protein
MTIPEGRARASAALLVCVNLAVAAYALIQRLGYAEILLLYWAETVVIGVLNIPKLIIVALFARHLDTVDDAAAAGNRLIAVLVALLFYVTIFALVWMLLFMGIIALPTLLQHADRAAGLAVERRPHPDETMLVVAIAVLALSHVFSFVVNFLLGREFRGASLVAIAVQPILRTALIIGIMALGLGVAFALPGVSRSAMFALVVIVLKTAADLHAHLAERRRFGQPSSMPSGKASGR